MEKPKPAKCTIKPNEPLSNCRYFDHCPGKTSICLLNYEECQEYNRRVKKEVRS